MKIVFATNNQHKVDEIRSALPAGIHIVSLKEADIDIDIPEPHDTLKENAFEKAKTIHTLTGDNCFSEDTGLEVYALNNEPGVHSARYAGDEKSSEKNIQKLLSGLRDTHERNARFRTVFCLILDEEEYFFEGICEGHISRTPKGAKGFGYDAVFVPAGAEKTFAEMDMQDKNLYSHRRKATDLLVAFLNTIQTKP
jgi:XTP/dITP diphosphohydrolase